MALIDRLRDHTEARKPGWQLLSAAARARVNVRVLGHGTREVRKQITHAIRTADSHPIEFPDCDQPLVSVVISVFNNWRYTRRCLGSLVALRSAVAFEVIVVDDASSDATAGELKRIPGLRVVTNTVNQGFTLATNAGARAASGRFTMFLNNDTVMLPGCLEALVEAFDDQGVAAVGAKLLDQSGLLQEAGAWVWNDGTAWNIGKFNAPTEPEYNWRREVDYCSAAALMVRSDLLEEVGYFDEHFAPAYYEDTDLCFALRARGYRVLFEPRAMVMHEEGRTHGSDNRPSIPGAHSKSSFETNRLRFVEKWRDALNGHMAPPPSLRRVAELRGSRPDPRPRILLCDWSSSRRDRSAAGRQNLLLRTLGPLSSGVTIVTRTTTALGSPPAQLANSGVELIMTDRRHFWRTMRHRRGLYDVVLLSRQAASRAMLAGIARFQPHAAVSVLPGGFSSAGTETADEMINAVLGLLDHRVTHGPTARGRRSSLPAAQKRIWIDLTDLERWNGQHGGVQRVTFNIADAFVDRAASHEIDLQFFAFSATMGRFRRAAFEPLKTKTVLNLSAPTLPIRAGSIGSRLTTVVQRYVPEVVWQDWRLKLASGLPAKALYAIYIGARSPFGASRRRDLVGRTEMVRFGEGDVVLLMGKPWDVPALTPKLARLKKERGFVLAAIIHDLVVPVQPHLHTPRVGSYYMQYLRVIAASADILLPVSYSTERDLLHFCNSLGLRRPHTRVIRLGDTLQEPPAAERPDFPGLTEPFVLCVGTVEIRKNHTLLYYAYKLAAERGVDLPQLVIVGRRGWLTDDLAYLLEHDPAVAGKIVVLDNVSDAGLAWLYRNCLFTIYPSIYEGWGLPVAEAARYGKLCLASRTSSVPEVAGDLMDYFSPYDSSACLSKILEYCDPTIRVAKEDVLKRRYRPSSWQETCEQVDAAIDEWLQTRSAPRSET